MRLLFSFIFCLIGLVSYSQRISDSLSFENVTEKYFKKGKIHQVFIEEDSTWYIYETDNLTPKKPLHEGSIFWPEKEGDYFEYDENKELIIYGSYEKNLENGLFLFFGETGKVVRSTHFEKGKLNGQAKHYYSNGQLRLSTDYKKGLKHGEILGFYIDGTRLFTGQYKKDKMIGQRNYFDVDGRPANGEMIWRHENGAIKLTGKCINGMPNGRFSHYDEKGELTLQVDYLHGIPDGAYIQYEYGIVVRKDCYKLGKPTNKHCM